MRRATPHRLAILLVAGGAVVACAQIAGLTDPTPGEGGSAPTGPLVEGDIDITPRELAFGDVKCGEDAVKTITIINNGSVAAPYEVKSGDPTVFDVSGVAVGNVPPKNTRTVDIVTKRAFVGDLAADLIVTVGSVLVRPIPAKATSSGAVLQISPSVAEFGEVRKQNGGSVEITIKNVGNRPATITGFAGATSDFSLLPNAVTVEADAVKVITAKLAPGENTAGIIEAKLTPDLADGLCGEPPAITMRGRRITTDITLTPAEWGNLDCTNNPPTRPIVISNYAAQQLDYVATLPTPTAFAFQGGTGTGTVPAAVGATPGVKNIVLGLEPGVSTTPAAREDELTVAITPLAAPSGGKVKAHVAVRGALITVTPSPVPDFASDGGTTDQKTITFTNTGNQSALLMWSFSGSNAWSTNLPGFPGASVGSSGGSLQRQVGFTATAAGTVNASFTASNNPFANVAHCRPLTSVPLKGTQIP